MRLVLALYLSAALSPTPTPTPAPAYVGREVCATVTPTPTLSPTPWDNPEHDGPIQCLVCGRIFLGGCGKGVPVWKCGCPQCGHHKMKRLR